jgi:hypothetical protein
MVALAPKVLRAVHRPRHRHGQCDQRHHRLHPHPRGQHHSQLQRELRARLKLHAHHVRIGQHFLDNFYNSLAC